MQFDGESVSFGHLVSILSVDMNKTVFAAVVAGRKARKYQRSSSFCNHVAEFAVNQRHLATEANTKIQELIVLDCRSLTAAWHPLSCIATKWVSASIGSPMLGALRF